MTYVGPSIGRIKKQNATRNVAHKNVVPVLRTVPVAILALFCVGVKMNLLDNMRYLVNLRQHRRKDGGGG